MRSRLWNLVRLTVLVLGLQCVSAQAGSIPVRIVTQGFAPLQWENDGRPDGYVTEFIQTVFDRVSERLPVYVSSFEFLPWKRAMLTAETEPNVLFFSISRTAEREDKFQWLGEVSPYGQYFYQLATRPDIDIERIADLRHLDVKIGIQDGSNLHAYLQELGFERSGRLVPVTDYRQGIEMLYRGRVDLIPLTGFLAEASACSQGFDGAQLEPVIFIEALAQPLWAVFSKGTDAGLVEAFSEEMAVLKEGGFLDREMVDHGKRWQKLACGT